MKTTKTTKSTKTTKTTKSPIMTARTASMAFFLAGLAALSSATPGCRPAASSVRFSGERTVLAIEGKRITVEVACDGPTRRLGLMDRESLVDNQGMLFIFPAHDYQGFWMKRTRIPLSIAFLDDDGTILQIEDMRPFDKSSTTSRRKVRYALEMNKGWFEKNEVAVGDRFEGFQESIQGFSVS